jgi:hypothetical protein
MRCEIYRRVIVNGGGRGDRNVADVVAARKLLTEDPDTTRIRFPFHSAVNWSFDFHRWNWQWCTQGFSFPSTIVISNKSARSSSKSGLLCFVRVVNLGDASASSFIAILLARYPFLLIFPVYSFHSTVDLHCSLLTLGLVSLSVSPSNKYSTHSNRTCPSSIFETVSGSSPLELALGITLWSPSDPPFSCRLGLFLSPGWTVPESDRELLDDMFDKLSGAATETFFHFICSYAEFSALAFDHWVPWELDTWWSPSGLVLIATRLSDLHFIYFLCFHANS